MSESQAKSPETAEVITLSKRGANMANNLNFMDKSTIRAEQDGYDPVTNPKGIINLGTSVNSLMEKEIEERLNCTDMFNFRSCDHLHYYDFCGLQRTRDALSNFFSRHIANGKIIPPDQFVILNGATSCMESLAFGLADTGDVFITPTPIYGRTFVDCHERTNVDVQPLHLLPKELTGRERDFELRAEDLETRIQELIAEGKTVAGLVLVNPQNPLGDIYSKELILDLLRVCAKYKIHAIFDEVYGLSMIGESQYTSVLALDDVPDPERTHFVWAMTKDFSLAGIRVGVIQSKSRQLHRYYRNTMTYNATPSIIHDLVATLLNDTDWCDNFYLPTSRKRITASYEMLSETLRVAGVHVHESKAAFFAWINISSFMKKETFEEEQEVFEEFFAAGLCVLPGMALHCKVPGWFRIVFTVKPDELTVGLQRLLEVLQRRARKPHAA